MKKSLTLVFLLTFLLKITAQKQPLSYYFRDNPTFDKNIPTPEEFLGYQIGEQHISHDQLVAYMRELDRLSDRISLQITGKTYENRSLMILTITSPENHKNIEKIRTDHLKLLDPSVSASLDVTKMPVVVYQGHSIHGNEASGANAGVLAAYYWAAAQGKDVEESLQNVVILFDPSFNPDGLQRFSQWVNMHRSQNLVSDPNSREFSEVWPYGRTNHYWFDLNRDWLVSQLPESQARLPIFHAWKPNILTDHHEMGSNASFFFQPGVPTRMNPYTPMKNFEITNKIAEFHAKALNKIGSQYYTKQGYDDFYYGKGSTYPDVQGCIGILFEQASSRGHAQRTSNGVLTFPFTIRNQLTTSFSTIEAARNIKNDLLNFQRDFYKNAMDESRRDSKKAYVFGDKYDRTKTTQFVELLRRSNIKVYELGQNHKDFDKNSSFIVPLEQTQYKLIKASFEKYVDGKDGFFADSLFYDISAWTLPLAFNIPCTAVDAGYSNAFLGKEVTALEALTGELVGGQSDYGYAFEYDDYLAPKLLNALLKEDLIVKTAAATFKVECMDGQVRAFNYGSIFIPAKNQSKSSDYIYNFIQNYIKKTGVKIYALKTGFSTEGVDMGSPSFQNVRRPNIAMLVGDGVVNNDAGEIWHLLDTRYDMQLTMIDVNFINRANLSAYSNIIMVDGTYGPSVAGKIREYLSSGGTVTAFDRAVKFLKNNDLCAVNFKISKNLSKEKDKRRSYASYENDEGSQVIGGAIYEADADLTHPLLYGYRTKTLPVFRADTLYLEVPQNVYAAPLIYKQNPLISGYANDKNKELAQGAASVVVSSVGSGKVIAMIENPTFRAFWYGTNKLLANMILFGNLVQSGTTEAMRTPASGGNR